MTSNEIIGAIVSLIISFVIIAFAVFIGELTYPVKDEIK